MLDEVVRDNIINVREWNIGNSRTQSNNEVNCVENELMKSRRLVKDLRTDTERLCAECDKFQNLHWSETCCISWKIKGWIMQSNARTARRREFEVDDTRKKMYDECELDSKEEYYDEYDSEEESECDRHLLCKIFDGWMHCVCNVRWELN